jgi:G3E family GTPase
MTTPSVPFTILTGFLGAGKTTTLNHMLAAPHGRKIAVLVNELGRIAIDTRLIVHRGGDVLELAGGCVCCKVDVKSDLWDGIAEVVDRSRPDHVVLETTGIAEPDAILKGLEQVPRVDIAAAGVICVVDGEAGPAQFARYQEAAAQVAAADRILVRKLDRANASQAAKTRAQLAIRAPAAEIASFPNDDDGAMAMTGWLLDVRPTWKVAHATQWRDDLDHGRGHHHHSQLRAAIFAGPDPLLGEAVIDVLSALGDRLVRAKGFLRLADDDRAAFLERAGSAPVTLHKGLPWTGPARTELVMIGDDLDEAALRRSLWACRASGR